MPFLTNSDDVDIFGGQMNEVAGDLYASVGHKADGQCFTYVPTPFSNKCALTSCLFKETNILGQSILQQQEVPEEDLSLLA